MKVEELVTASQMKTYDNTTIEILGVDALLLMEQAACRIVDVCVSLARLHLTDGKKVLIVCGTGNNGGDGMAVARMLLDRGILADVVLAGSPDKLSREAKKQYEILKNYGILCKDGIAQQERYGMVIDALFGVGLARDVEGSYAKMLLTMNGISAYKIAVDIPSGIDSDTGKVRGVAFKADQTVTLGYKKKGMVRYPGCLYCGEITVANIGIGKTAVAKSGILPEAFTLSGSPMGLFARRIPNGNKGSFGKLLLIAGSEDMAGAALLCAMSAYKTGVGMVKVVLPGSIAPVLNMRLPEALLLPYHSKDGLSEEECEKVRSAFAWADAVAIGPGLSLCKSAKMLLKCAVEEEKLPLLIDADALNLLAKETACMEALIEKAKQKPIVLTPHMGELARLLAKSVEEICDDEEYATKELAYKTHAAVCGKSARTYVYEEGQRLFINTAGSDRMATAGSGDVLSGIIGAFLARGLSAYDAAVNGVYLHAYAGDIARDKAGGFGLTASDIPAEINLEQKEEPIP